MEENKNFEQEQHGQEEEKPVSLGKKKTGLIVIAFLIVLILILCMVRGCSVTREVKGTQNQQQTQSQVNNSQQQQQQIAKTTETQKNSETKEAVNSESTKVSETTSNGTVSSSESSEKSVENVESSVGSSTNINSANTNDNNVPVEVSSPELGNSIESSGMVSGKHTYSWGTSYLYEVSLVIVTGDGNSIVGNYFCPKNTYDNLSMGDSLSVTYQLDGQNNISISTISK